MKAVYSEFTLKLSTTSLLGVLKVQKQVDGLLSGTARLQICLQKCKYEKCQTIIAIVYK